MSLRGLFPIFIRSTVLYDHYFIILGNPVPPHTCRRLPLALAPCRTPYVRLAPERRTRPPRSKANARSGSSWCGSILSVSSLLFLHLSCITTQCGGSLQRNRNPDYVAELCGVVIHPLTRVDWGMKFEVLCLFVCLLQMTTHEEVPSDRSSHSFNSGWIPTRFCSLFGVSNCCHT